jgi:hypothetical protein
MCIYIYIYVYVYIFRSHCGSRHNQFKNLLPSLHPIIASAMTRAFVTSSVTCAFMTLVIVQVAAVRKDYVNVAAAIATSHDLQPDRASAQVSNALMESSSKEVTRNVEVTSIATAGCEWRKCTLEDGRVRFVADSRSPDCKQDAVDKGYPADEDPAVLEKASKLGQAAFIIVVNPNDCVESIDCTEMGRGKDYFFNEMWAYSTCYGTYVSEVADLPTKA